MEQTSIDYTQNRFNFSTLSRVELLDRIDALAKENGWIRDCLASKDLTDKEKVHCMGLYFFLQTQVRRADGFRYYSRQGIAKLLGEIPKPPKRNKRGELVHDPSAKEQALSDTMTMLKDNGAIDRTGEPQKNDPIKQNSFCFTYPMFEDISLFRKKAIEDKPERGGKRLATCNHCGSTRLREKVLYVCEDCGGTMDENQIVKISEATLEFQKQLDAELAEEMLRRNLLPFPTPPGPPPPPTPPAPPAADDEPPEKEIARKLFKELRLKVRVSKTPRKSWNVPESGQPFDLIANHEYVRNLENMCRTNDVVMINAAIKEMKRYLKRD